MIENALKNLKAPRIGKMTGCLLFLAVMGLAGAGLSALDTTPGFTAIVLSLMALSGLLLLDIFNRQVWEKQVTGEINAVKQNHDRLVREVARSRQDVAALKHGLHRVTESVAEQGKKHSPSPSIESRLLSTLVAGLASLGEKAQPAAAAITDSPIVKSHILELQMIPPAANPPPSGPLGRELDAADHFTDNAVRELVRHAIGNDNVSVFMQPVVRLPQRKTHMYEIYGRILARPGSWLPAARYKDVAEKSSLVTAIDNLLLQRCLQMLRETDGKAPEFSYMLNVSGASLRDSGFMGDLVAFLSKNRHMAKRLVFELAQADLESMDAVVGPVIDGLSRLGCRFSMDHVRQRRLDLHKLKSRHIRYLKLDALWLLRESKAKGGYSRVLQLKKELDAVGIDLIVEKIENEALLRELLDFNIDLGQGFLFGKPDRAAAYQDKRKVA
jgi:cyclic-di-GMP phosphodiesterase, flagellum assembly factor TipF